MSQNVTKWTLNRNQSAPAWIEIEHILNSFGFAIYMAIHYIFQNIRFFLFLFQKMNRSEITFWKKSDVCLRSAKWTFFVFSLFCKLLGGRRSCTIGAIDEEKT